MFRGRGFRVEGFRVQGLGLRVEGEMDNVISLIQRIFNCVNARRDSTTGAGVEEKKYKEL